jgi:hypothetical protein
MTRAGYVDIDQPMNRGMSLAAGYDDIDLVDRPPVRNFSLTQASRNAARRIRAIFPVRQYDGGERQSLLSNRSAPRNTLGAFLNRHKRKLIIGGAIAGTVGVVGGTIASIVSAKRKKTMQSNAGEAKGMFEQLSSGPVSLGGGGGGSSGGGGGGGFGRYQTIQAAARKYKARGGSRKRKHTAKKTKKRNTVKHGKVHKKKNRRTKKTIQSINKKGRKGKKKGKKKAAF